MGKRKSSSKPQTGKKGPPPLDTVFECLFCQNDGSVSVKLDQKESIGLLRCKICGQKFSCHITPLSAAIDVYTDWIDACEDANAEEQRAAQGGPASDDEEEVPRRSSSKSKRKKRRDGDTDDEDVEADYERVEEEEEEEEDQRQKKRKTSSSSSKSKSKSRVTAEDFSDEDDF